MLRLKVCGAFFLILPFLILMGCGDETTSFLNPKSDIHVILVDRPTVTAEFDDNNIIINRVYQDARFDFAINNGVSAFLESAEVRYYDRFGKEVLTPLLTQKYGVSLFVQAPDVKSRGAGTGTTGGSSSSSTGGGTGAKIMAQVLTPLPGTSGFLNLTLYNGEVFDFIHNDTVGVTEDDNSPLQVEVTFRGRDVNGNTLQFTGQVRLDNLFAVKEGG